MYYIVLSYLYHWNNTFLYSIIHYNTYCFSPSPSPVYTSFMHNYTSFMHRLRSDSPSFFVNFLSFFLVFDCFGIKFSHIWHCTSPWNLRQLRCIERCTVSPVYAMFIQTGNWIGSLIQTGEIPSGMRIERFLPDWTLTTFLNAE